MLRDNGLVDNRMHETKKQEDRAETGAREMETERETEREREGKRHTTSERFVSVASFLMAYTRPVPRLRKERTNLSRSAWLHCFGSLSA